MSCNMAASQPTHACGKVSLLDLLTSVPNLLSKHMLAQWPTPGAGIRVLRSVCKGVNEIAVQAIVSCKLELGQGSKPASHKKVAKLLSKAHLKTMTLTVITYPGEISRFSRESDVMVCLCKKNVPVKHM